MEDAGILPDNCRRVIIDIAYDDAVKVYYECYGDERLLKIDFASHIGAMIKRKPAEDSDESEKTE
ncbi:hypothetical protein LCGC14_0939470 [marine sediment metagenome]|uniref:Uncharacterized protein n=1 Tax=marine sediment metagenome TaxID=412755 RepID=A0A0F9RRU8_9ZZZZ